MILGTTSNISGALGQVRDGKMKNAHGFKVHIH